MKTLWAICALAATMLTGCYPAPFDTVQTCDLKLHADTSPGRDAYDQAVGFQVHLQGAGDCQEILGYVEQAVDTIDAAGVMSRHDVLVRADSLSIWLRKDEEFESEGHSVRSVYRMGAGDVVLGSHMDGAVHEMLHFLAMQTGSDETQERAHSRWKDSATGYKQSDDAYQGWANARWVAQSD